jgi:uncharacterized protein YndB with AHSA1/START domain
MRDILDELNSVQREVGTATTTAGEGRMVVLRRTYRADIEDVWDALTTPERIGRWFLPVSGDFRVGGRFQTEGNAGGEILACDAPSLLRVTWSMGEGNDGSEVEVRLSKAGADETLFELEHRAPVPAEMWAQFGPGAVGVGWEGAVLGLGWYLESGRELSAEEKAAWPMSEEARVFNTAAAQAWGAAHEASGASPDEAAAAATNTTAFYVPPAEG